METADRDLPAGADDEPVVLDRRSRRAFTISLLVVVAVVVVALGYSFVRDPGPQPTVPPTISGTDDGALKRAIVHYVGALESKQVSAMTDVMGDDSERSQSIARAVIDEFGAAAQQPTKVTVTRGPDADAIQVATVTFEDGRAQSVQFRDVDGTWRPMPSAPPTPRASASS